MKTLLSYIFLSQLLLKGVVSEYTGTEQRTWYERVLEGQDEDPSLDGVPIRDYRLPRMPFEPKYPEDIVKANDVEEIDEEEEFLDDPLSSAKSLREEASRMKKDVEEGEYGGRSSPYDVIIVGAGWSGLAAAMRLQAEGISNFKILEGRDYVGGRSYTRNFNGEDLDMGSMWLLYGSCNPIHDHAVSLGTSMRPYKDKLRLYMPSGERMPFYTLKYYVEYIYYTAWWSYITTKQYVVDNDESYTETVSEMSSLLGRYSEADAKIAFFTTFLQMVFTIPYGVDLKDLGLWYADDGAYLCRTDDDQFVQSGFSNIVQTFAEPVEDRIQTEAAVEIINYKNDNVKVIYEDRSTGEENRIYAKKVIVTAPIGVLQEEKIKFRPKLSSHMMEGINGLGMSWQIRLFMFWDEEDVFWPQLPDVFMDATTAQETDLQVKYYIPTYLHETPKTYMFAIIRSDEAKEIERLYAQSDEAKYIEEITKIAMVPLRGLFGEDIPDPELATANQWTYDEFSYGAYSHNKIGHKKSFRSRLKVPVDDKLFFAGEGTSSRHWGTVHGAYISGNLAAKRVLESFNATMTSE